MMDNTYSKIIGELIKEYRQKKRLSLRDIVLKIKKWAVLRLPCYKEESQAYISLTIFPCF